MLYTARYISIDNWEITKEQEVIFEDYQEFRALGEYENEYGEACCKVAHFPEARKWIIAQIQEEVQELQEAIKQVRNLKQRDID